MKAALFVLVSLFALAETPPAVTELLRLTTDAMANSDATEVLRHFDPAMPSYADFAQRISVLLGSDSAASTVEIIRDEGDESKRKLELNWLLQIGNSRQKRGKVTVTVERKGSAWVFTSIEPLQFFDAP
jgi:hypothetical protein